MPYPIPEGSVITAEMVDSFAKHCGVEPTDDNAPSLVGSLVAWETGQGEFDEMLVNDPTFAPLIEAFNVARCVSADTEPANGSPTESAPTLE